MDKMRDITTRYFIYSTYRSTDAFSEDTYHKELEYLKSKGLVPIQVKGQYKGIKEDSILLIGDNNLESFVAERSNYHFQESYLVVYWDLASELVFSDGARKMLGRWSTLDQKPKEGDYSEINGKYYNIAS